MLKNGTETKELFFLLQVLYQLVRYLNLENLKALRSVHSTWNRAIIPRLKKFCRVVFRPIGAEEEEELRLLAASQYSQFNAEVHKLHV